MIRPILFLTLIAGTAGLVTAQSTDQPPSESASAAAANIVMIAGPPSHGYGAHEHYAGLRILQSAVEAADANVTVHRGWPTDAAVIRDADSIVFFADGGGRHPAIEHYDQLRQKMADGCGIAAIHYAVETIPGPVGDEWLDWMGGHFEVNYSVNPHWSAQITPNKTHPVTANIAPFESLDEWYFHLRFKSDVVPLLQAVAPEETMRRGDGEHSGNPAVRKSVAAGEVQTLAWAYQRPSGDLGGGRSFGISGGHFHWVWGVPQMLETTAGGIRWTAGLSPQLPSDAPEMPRVTQQLLLENQDEKQPANFDDSKIQSYLAN